MDWNTVLNLIGVILFWVWMNEAFERNTPYVAYLYLFLSAWNGAAIGARYINW